MNKMQRLPSIGALSTWRGARRSRGEVMLTAVKNYLTDLVLSGRKSSQDKNRYDDADDNAGGRASMGGILMLQRIGTLAVVMLFVVTMGGVSIAAANPVDLNLGVAAYQGNAGKVEELLAKGPTQEGLDNALSSVIRSRFFGSRKDAMMKIMDLLIEKGANVNQKNRSGHPLLFDIAGGGNSAVLEYFLKKGGKVDISDRGGQLIHRAAFQGRLQNVQVLLRYGATVNTAGNAGSTPLHSAAIRGDLPAMKVGEFLIEKGARINAVDSLGRTPLVMASMNGRTDFVKMLIGKGADLNIRTKNGVTALSAAKGLYRCYNARGDGNSSRRAAHYRELMEVLASRGAKDGSPYRISGGR